MGLSLARVENLIAVRAEVLAETVMTHYRLELTRKQRYEMYQNMME
jgi:hypothetical protein